MARARHRQRGVGGERELGQLWRARCMALLGSMIGMEVGLKLYWSCRSQKKAWAVEECLSDEQAERGCEKEQQETESWCSFSLLFWSVFASPAVTATGGAAVSARLLRATATTRPL